MRPTNANTEFGSRSGAVFSAPPQSFSFCSLIAVVRSIDWISYALVTTVMALMSVMLFAQVIARYGFAASIDSATELSRLFFVWSIFLAIPHGIKYGVHVGIDVGVRMLPFRAQELIFRSVAVISAVAMVVLFYYTFLATADKSQELMPTLPITSAIYYIPVLIACGHSVLHFIAYAWGGPRTWEGERP